MSDESCQIDLYLCSYYYCCCHHPRRRYLVKLKSSARSCDSCPRHTSCDTFSVLHFSEERLIAIHLVVEFKSRLHTAPAEGGKGPNVFLASYDYRHRVSIDVDSVQRRYRRSYLFSGSHAHHNPPIGRTATFAFRGDLTWISIALHVVR